tara:strand:+ start:154 stop:315 length:162 start_codon:yes stop_codon:yes gene_type:complete
MTNPAVAINVLDFVTLSNGPFYTMPLAELGINSIKIESKGGNQFLPTNVDTIV